MQNNKNVYAAMSISVFILIIWQIFYMNPKIEKQRELARITAQQALEAKKPNVVNAPLSADTSLSLNDAKKQTSRIIINTPMLEGSINLTGARFDDIVLKKYRETIDPKSAPIHLLAPSLTSNGYFAEIGFIGDESMGKLPDSSTVWTVEGNSKLTQTTPATLTFTNDKGLTFKRTIAVDENYMFTINDTVTNTSDKTAEILPYGRLTRYEKPKVAAVFVAHEGALGYSSQSNLQEHTFSSLEEDKEFKPVKSSDGWLGFTDKYWATALIPSGKMPYQPKYSYFADGKPRFQVDYLSDAFIIKPSETQTIETLFFAGAKEAKKITAYGTDKVITRFDLMIDWGWFYFFTKPMFYVLDWLNHMIGNFGLAILAITVLVKILFLPLANKSYVSMAHMKTAQPKMAAIKEKYPDDRQKQQEAMVQLYKTEKINPIAGCWPTLLQIPVFFALYKVISTTIEMRHAPFYGWIHDLSAKDPTSLFNLFGLLPFDVPTALMIGVWPLLMGITMFLQMRMNPAPTDQAQAMIFSFMPVVFTFTMASFPAGLVMYMAWSNFLSILQQGFIMKRNGTKIELWDNLTALFKKKPKAT
jgi:YidC/Oxa1 family membrane protein insertase